MPHAAPPPPVPPVPVFGPLTGLLSEQSTPLGIFLALARLGMSLLSRFLPFMSTQAGRYPRHWRAFLESSIALLRVLLTVRFAPERITVAQFRKLWRARQLIESLFGRPLPIFHSAESLGARTPSSATATANQSPSPLGARTPSSANATSNQSPSASTENAPTPGTPISRLASEPASSNPQPHPPQPRTPGTPSIPQVPFCSLAPDRSRSQTPSSSESRSRSRSKKRAPASLQSIIAMMEASQSNPQPSSPHSASRTPHSSLPPFIPDVGTLHAALKADTLPPNCAGALLDKPADTLVKALQQVHALIQAFPQLSPSPSSGNPQSDAPSVHPVHSVHPVSNVNAVNAVNSLSPAQSAISNLKSEIPNSPSPSESPLNPQSAIHNPQSDAPP